MLACINNWELDESRLHHAVDNQELDGSFKNLYLDEDASGVAAAISTSGAGTSGSASVASAVISV